MVEKAPNERLSREEGEIQYLFERVISFFTVAAEHFGSTDANFDVGYWFEFLGKPLLLYIEGKHRPFSPNEAAEYGYTRQFSLDAYTDDMAEVLHELGITELEIRPKLILQQDQEKGLKLFIRYYEKEKAIRLFLEPYYIAPLFLSKIRNHLNTPLLSISGISRDSESENEEIMLQRVDLSLADMLRDLTEEHIAFLKTRLDDIEIMTLQAARESLTQKGTYLLQEIANSLGLKKSTVHKTLKRVVTVVARERYITVDNDSIDNDSSLFYLIYNKSRFTPLQLACLSAYQREVFEYYTTPNSEGRYPTPPYANTFREKGEYYGANTLHKIKEVMENSELSATIMMDVLFVENYPELFTPEQVIVADKLKKMIEAGEPLASSRGGLAYAVLSEKLNFRIKGLLERIRRKRS